MSRVYPGTINTPEGFSISSLQELVTYWDMFVERELWDKSWIEELRKAKQPCILDIGANYGLFCRLALQFNPGAQITAFEPQANLAKKVQQGLGITCHPIALSDENAQATLHLDPGDGETASLVAYQHSGRTATVELKRLDDFWPREKVPFLVKIDVDGVEVSVVKGGQETLSRTGFIIIEASQKSDLTEIDRLLPRHRRKKISFEADYLYSLT